MKHETTHQVPNYGKIAMLHRQNGSTSFVIYAGTPENCKKLFDVFQEWNNNSGDITLDNKVIRCKNPMLAWHLMEIVKVQTIVPESDALSGETAGCIYI